MKSEPKEFAQGAASLVQDAPGASWTPLYWCNCTFGPDIFSKVMTNFIHNPNLNSSWLFRADILVDQDPAQTFSLESTSNTPEIVHFRDFTLDRVLVRRLIPRNTLRDKPLDQTCLKYHSHGVSEITRSLVVYKPHVSSPSDMPFYHPKIQGLAFLHDWKADHDEGTISMHYQFFEEDGEPSPKLVRTAFNLLALLHKHGQGSKEGYVKRVHHDTIIPQVSVQTTYARLKEKYARPLIDTWAEVTDPSKHVFEDLGIAAFLIELWAQMYGNSPFPGFVDIGCGNGLLVYILKQEGYTGWGFDARKRKSWDQYGANDSLASGKSSGPSLQQRVLLPSIVPPAPAQQEPPHDVAKEDAMIHNGEFSRGTFIISNHADELTPWTPILAAMSECPFIMIPCCSHDLSGARFRAPAPKQSGKSPSAYSSLVEWVVQIASDCGWEVEREMLRIPSTRNTGLVGRRRVEGSSPVDIAQVVARYGGTYGYADNVMKLVQKAPRGH
jgi:tRNASer (uridine44-2'-O)-methyltransferase